MNIFESQSLWFKQGKPRGPKAERKVIIKEMHFGVDAVVLTQEQGSGREEETQLTRKESPWDLSPRRHLLG